jgi:hypothetical protein
VRQLLIILVDSLQARNGVHKPFQCTKRRLNIIKVSIGRFLIVLLRSLLVLSTHCDYCRQYIIPIFKTQYISSVSGALANVLYMWSQGASLEVKAEVYREDQPGRKSSRWWKLRLRQTKKIRYQCLSPPCVSKQVSEHHPASNDWTRRDEEAWQDCLRRRSDVITPLSSGPSLFTAQKPKPVIEHEVGDDDWISELEKASPE